jgi:hypothetical protein
MDTGAAVANVICKEADDDNEAVREPMQLVDLQDAYAALQLQFFIRRAFEERH